MDSWSKWHKSYQHNIRPMESMLWPIGICETLHIALYITPESLYPNSVDLAYCNLILQSKSVRFLVQFTTENLLPAEGWFKYSRV